ncbi:Putative uncharacterized protein [Moritella viscosa]|nr:Putative uncharacterized protein [Moritella viscosa]
MGFFNGWEAKDAKELGKLGRRIGDGGRVQIKNKTAGVTTHILRGKAKI